MREIEHRGKRKDNGEWVTGSLILSNFSVFIATMVNTLNSEKITDLEYYEVDPATVGQFTGLRDSKRIKEYPKGQPIYEGDIVRYPDAYGCYSECGTEYEDTVSVGVIEWDNNLAQFYVTNRETVDLEVFWEDIDKAEVIGNIYDNPELLNVA